MKERYSFQELMNAMNVGLVSYHIYKNEWITCGGDLPDVPKDYFLPLIENDNKLYEVFNYLKKRNKEIDQKYSKEYQELCSIGSSDYESECFFVHLWLGNIFDYWFGKLPPIDNNNIDCDCDILGMDFWKYLRDECTLDELKSSAKNLYEDYIKYIS